MQRINDSNGNRLREVRRALPADTAPLATDTYTLVAGTNRLASVRTGNGTAAPVRTFGYDARGNTASESRPGGIAKLCLALVAVTRGFDVAAAKAEFILR